MEVSKKILMFFCILLIIFNFNTEIKSLCSQLLTPEQLILFVIGTFTIGLYVAALSTLFRKQLKSLNFRHIILFISCGAFISGPLAYLALYQLDGPVFNAHTTPIVGAILEETLKLIIFWILYFITKSNFQKLFFDAFILASLVGLGFQVYEDYIYVLNHINDCVMDFANAIIYRCSLFFASHWMYTGISGIGLVWLIKKMNRSIGILLLVIPSGLHILWNSSWNNSVLKESIISTLTIIIYMYTYQTCIKEKETGIETI